MAKNIWGKTRDKNDPYATVTVGDWTWHILKAYQTRAKEKENKYARLFCAVRSPATMGSFDMGDTYISDIPKTEEFVKALAEREKLEENHK